MFRRSTVTARAALLALAALLCGCARPQGGSETKPTALVVSNRSGAFRIYEVDLDGGLGRLIGSARADDPAYDDTMPARLPDGRIVFVSTRDGQPGIYLASADGGAVERLSRDAGEAGAADSDPAPLGRDRIVFARGDPRGAPRDLYILRLDRPELRRLTRDPGDDGAPWGSPDGQRVVFVSDRGGAPRIWMMDHLEDPDPEASAVDLSGQAPARGIRAPDPRPYSDSAPALLPDGSIVFGRAAAGDPPHLFLMDAAGARAGLRQVTEALTLPFGAGEPVILADGTILLHTGPFVALPGGKKAPRFAVYRIAAGGFNLSRVSRDRGGYDDFTRRLATGHR